MRNYRVIQLTSASVGAVAAGAIIPLGNVTRRVQCNAACSTYDVSSVPASIVTVNEAGNYNVTYSASLTAEAAGDLSITLQQNGVSVYAVSATATEAGTVNVSLTYQIRVRPNCESVAANLPAYLRFVLGGVAITGGTSNVIVERVH